MLTNYSLVMYEKILHSLKEISLYSRKQLKMHSLNSIIHSNFGFDDRPTSRITANDDGDLKWTSSATAANTVLNQLFQLNLFSATLSGYSKKKKSLKMTF